MARRLTPKKKSRESAHHSLSSSLWSRVSDEITQGWGLRKQLIANIERQVKGKVIVYFTSFRSANGMITDNDAEMIENLLSAEHDRGRIVMVLSSAGGFGLAAERLVNVCRAYSAGNFEVIVPHMAKSAATLVCFGASRIYMSPTAELGPVDPQVKYYDDNGKEQWISAEEYVRSYDELLDKATCGKAPRIESLLQQLARYDARYIEKLRSAQALSKSISVKLLQSGMMLGRTEEWIEKKISSFLLQKETSSHGRMITMAEARGYGLKIKGIDIRSRLWSSIWELYIRANCVVSSRCGKILESSLSSVSIPWEAENDTKEK
jgi:hypothetical protein